MKDIHLQIPSSADYIDIVRACLYSVASKLGFSYEDIEDMKVAVSEACNNAVLHGSQAFQNNKIDISFESSDSDLIITIQNDGPSFAHTDTLNNAAPLQVADIRDLPVGGLGIFLMQALMDNVTVETNDHKTEVTLIKSIKR